VWNRNPSVFWGGVLVIVGALFLLANLGVLSNLNWDVVWPVLLIALGVWLVVGRIGPGGASADVDSSEPREGLDKAKLEVSVGAARLEVAAAPLDDQLYRVHIEHAGTPPEVRLDRATGTVRISQRSDWFMGARRLHVDAKITDAIPWEVSCSTGAIRGEFDLSLAALNGFVCRTGASQIEVVLGPPRGMVPIRVEGGALTVSIARPAGAAVQVQASGGAVQLHGDGERQEGLGTRSWKSNGFDAATDRYEVTVSGGALNVDVSAR
jgi:cell wall-active antibiotic response 4TMS protein YvqF